MAAGTSETPDRRAVRDFLESTQAGICAALEALDGEARFRGEEIARPGGGVSRPRVLEDGPLIEKAAVNFTHTEGAEMPGAATQRRPELAGRRYEAISVSLIVHPRNPWVPTCHANYRFFLADDPAGGAPVWWFGGGFDLTPYYGFEEDAIHWHRTARAACEVHSPELYPRFKAQCDAYFFLPHRNEPRGIGGIFYDDFDEGGFARAFALWRATAEAFLAAYRPIVERRRDLVWGEREREFQLYRRGRYVEFNLLQDRGTRFGLQAGARTESACWLPPRVAWRYDWSPEPGTAEHASTRSSLAAAGLGRRAAATAFLRAIGPGSGRVRDRSRPSAGPRAWPERAAATADGPPDQRSLESDDGGRRRVGRGRERTLLPTARRAGDRRDRGCALDRA
ncbi:MAG: oxygen-dependent coproporphyrinogen oxidase [Myxococcota bacterium]